MIYQCKLKTDKKSRTPWNLVLDMDETLLHTFHHIRDLHELDMFNPTNVACIPLRKSVYKIDLPRPDGGYDEYWGMYRPYLTEFLKFANEFFDNIIIWSAGTTDYVHDIIRKMFRDHESPSAVLTRPHCVQDKDFIEKPIEKISDICNMYQNVDLSNTLIVDDRETAYSDSNPENGIMIPPFEPEPTIKGMCKDDIALLQLQLWFELMHLKYPRADVRALDKSRIFTTTPSMYRRELEMLRSSSKRRR